MKREFGTDGIRGRVPDELDHADAMAVGYAVGKVFPDAACVIGCDTRDSGAMLAAGAMAGLSNAGVESEWLGVATTPAVAHIAKVHKAAGIVITASHNYYPDNGLKVFTPQGLKPEDSEQAKLESWLQKSSEADSSSSSQVSAQNLEADLADFFQNPPEEIQDRHLRHYARSLPKPDLSGVKVVVDCANGAASAIAPIMLKDLGAEVIGVGTSPDGQNINLSCGSTAPEQMLQAVRDSSADCGFSLDGDGDRIVMVSPKGTLLDGDDLLALLAYSMKEELADSSVVITPMTNLGLRRAFADWGLATAEVPVGDRNIQAKLYQEGWSLGGEPSGHIISLPHSHSSDGLLVALLVLEFVARTRHDLDSQLYAKVPQALCNVAVSGDQKELAENMTPHVSEIQGQLGDTARIVVRASGTEPVLRIMVESEDDARNSEVLQQLSDLAAQLTN